MTARICHDEAELIMYLVEQTTSGNMPHHIGNLLKVIMPAYLSWVQDVEDDDEALHRLSLLPQVQATLVIALITGIFRPAAVPATVALMGDRFDKALKEAAEHYLAAEDEAEAP